MQYPLGWIVVSWLYRHGLWEVHTWKELLFIKIYLYGAIASICLAVIAMALSPRRTGRPLLESVALVLSVLNLLPTAIVIGGW